MMLGELDRSQPETVEESKITIKTKAHKWRERKLCTKIIWEFKTSDVVSVTQTARVRATALSCF